MLNNGDFIKLDYEGYDEEGKLFDSTRGEIGKTIHGKDGPMLIVVGHYSLVKGLDEAIRTMKKGEEKEVKFGPDKGFGERSKKLVRVMNLSDFHDHNFTPQPGITVHFDTTTGRIYGTIKSVSGGRVLVDFNHPLAGKNVRYKIKMLDLVENTEQKLKLLMEELALNGNVTLKDGEVLFTLNKEGEEYEFRKSTLIAMVKTFMPELKKVDAVDKELKSEETKKKSA